MIRYNITVFRSRDPPAASAERPIPGLPGTHRVRVVDGDDWPRVCRSLVASIAAHVAIAIGFDWFAGRAVPRIEPEPEMVTLMFQPTIPVSGQSAKPSPLEAPATAAPVQPLPEPELASVPAMNSVPPEPVAAGSPVEPPPEPGPELVPLAGPDRSLPLPPPPVAPAPPTPPPSVLRPPPRPHNELPHPTGDLTTAPAPAALRTAPAGAVPAPTARAAQNIISPEWRSALSNWLQAHKTYPDEARQRGDQGSATVRFTVGHDGHVQELRVLSATGSAILNSAVDRLLRGAHLPAFPPGMDQAKVTVTLQIHYTLER